MSLHHSHPTLDFFALLAKKVDLLISATTANREDTGRISFFHLKVHLDNLVTLKIIHKTDAQHASLSTATDTSASFDYFTRIQSIIAKLFQQMMLALDFGSSASSFSAALPALTTFSPLSNKVSQPRAT